MFGQLESTKYANHQTAFRKSIAIKFIQGRNTLLLKKTFITLWLLAVQSEVYFVSLFRAKDKNIVYLLPWVCQFINQFFEFNEDRNLLFLDKKNFKQENKWKRGRSKLNMNDECACMNEFEICWNNHWRNVINKSSMIKTTHRTKFMVIF